MGLRENWHARFHESALFANMLVNYAYEMGFHEGGYDPIATMVAVRDMYDRALRASARHARRLQRERDEALAQVERLRRAHFAYVASMHTLARATRWEIEALLPRVELALLSERGLDELADGSVKP